CLRLSSLGANANRARLASTTSVGYIDIIAASGEITAGAETDSYVIRACRVPERRLGAYCRIARSVRVAPQRKEAAANIVGPYGIICQRRNTASGIIVAG